MTTKNNNKKVPTIKQLQYTQNNETKITNDYEILKYCKTFFSNLHTKTKTNIQIQEELPKPKINTEQNEKLTHEITPKELKNVFYKWRMQSHKI